MQLDAEREMARLDALLKPIANQKADVNNPNWLTDLVAEFRVNPPIDQVGGRAQAEAVLRQLIERYATGGEPERVAIRELFSKYKAFRWAAGLPGELQTADDLRNELILLSAHDQSADARDDILTLQALCRKARERGITVEPILAEVAAMSSDVDRYGMGSTRDIFLSRGRG